MFLLFLSPSRQAGQFITIPTQEVIFSVPLASEVFDEKQIRDL
ncbi:unnamed protein product, partial [marine sediment metagenome]